VLPGVGDIQNTGALSPCKQAGGNLALIGMSCWRFDVAFDICIAVVFDARRNVTPVFVFICTTTLENRTTE